MDHRVTTSSEARPAIRLLTRPLRLGLSVGHPSGTCGSIGPFVRDSSGKVGFLSTANVLAPPKAQPGDFIHQPSAVDFDLTGASRVGELSSHIARPEVVGNATDAAVAWLIDPSGGFLNAIPPDLPDAGHLFTLDGRPLSLGDLVATAGRTTGYNHGTVETIEMIVPIRIGGNMVSFNDCIAIRGPHGAFTQPGDAGALVWRIEDCMAVGIVFAAASTPDVTFVLPLTPILARFNLFLA